MNDYSIVERPPTVKEYQALRVAVGWGEADEIAIGKSIDNSLYWVSLRKQEAVIGCGRVVGDGGLCFYLQDLIVLPAYRGQGLGHRLMEKLMEYVQANARQGGFVGLMAAKGVEEFYVKYGFMKRPTPKYGPGMILFWK